MNWHVFPELVQLYLVTSVVVYFVGCGLAAGQIARMFQNHSILKYFLIAPTFIGLLTALAKGFVAIMPWTSRFEHGGIGVSVAVLLAMCITPLLMIYAYQASKSAAEEFKRSAHNQ